MKGLLLENELCIPYTGHSGLRFVEFQPLNQLSVDFLQIVDGVLQLLDFLLLLRNLRFHLAHLNMGWNVAVSLTRELVELVEQVETKVELGGLLENLEGLVGGDKSVHLGAMRLSVLCETVILGGAISLLQDFLRKAKSLVFDHLSVVLLW